MTRVPTLTIGTRVRFKGNPSGITLRSDTGEVVRTDRQDGYYIVRLDEPAIVHDVPDTGQEISEIVEAAENLDVIKPAG
jgi:hypothetical protein